MKTGISKYSKQFGLGKEEVQILVTSNQSEEVNYMICTKWNPKQKISFKNIMDVKVDILGFEALASPFLHKSVEMYAKYYDGAVSEVNLFLFEKNKKIGVAVYLGKTFKETLTLEKQFERLGL